MVKRIIAIIFIFACTTVAWLVLGATIFARTGQSDSALRGKVASTWGAPQTQTAAVATWEKVETKQVESTEDGKRVTRTVIDRTAIPLPLEQSRVTVALDLDQRQKGLQWYSTYKVAFGGTYRFRNTGASDLITFRLLFPTTQAIYDDLTVTIDGAPAATHDIAAMEPRGHGSGVEASARVAAGASATLVVAYRSQGLNTWSYSFGGGDVSRVKDFALTMRTNFADVDFPDNTLSPSEKHERAGGWDLGWHYANLISGYEIGMVMPEHLQPGPLAGKISLFAPVSLFFFFFVMFIITTVRGIELHPMNYFFLAGAFFAFHLLLAYLVDHMEIHAAFAIASVTSVFLVASYLRLVIGPQFALREAALAQIVYLVLFSYAFFFEGFTGLAITIGSVATLFVVMQMTGRIRWSEKFAATPRGG